MFADSSTALAEVSDSGATLVHSGTNEWVPCVNAELITNYFRYAAASTTWMVNVTVTEEYPEAFGMVNATGICVPYGPAPNYTYSKEYNQPGCAPLANFTSVSRSARRSFEAPQNPVCRIMRRLRCLK